MATGDLAAGLTEVLRPLLGADTGVDNLRALTGGASRTTWAFDAVTGPDRRALILRTAPTDDIHAGMELEALAEKVGADDDVVDILDNGVDDQQQHHQSDRREGQ